MVAGQTDMIPSSDDGGEEDRERPWTHQLEWQMPLRSRENRGNVIVDMY